MKKIIALIAALLPLASHGAEVKLKAAAFLPVKSVFVQQFGRYVEEVNKQCAGKVAISVVGPEAIKSLEQWNALKTGVVEMHYGPPNYYVGAMPEGDVISVARNETATQRAISAAVAILVNHDRWQAMEEPQRQCLTQVAMWAEKEWPKWRAAEDGKQQKVQDDAGIKYVDLGPAFAQKAEDLYWQEMEKGDAQFAKKVRPL